MIDDDVSAAFCLPFFGSLPHYFDHWVKSCEINHDHFHWFVYSDHVRRRRRLNRAVTVIPYTFDAMAADFKNIFGIEIFRENLRMICNYRILFYSLRRGKEPLDRYDFIGYTDLDMIYGDLAQFMPKETRDYHMISGDDGHPCGPFTLMRRESASALPDLPQVREAMEVREFQAFDESTKFMEVVSAGRPVCCRTYLLQPAMSAGFDHRKTFSVWDRGRVTVWDCRGHRREGGFYHFSRFKDKQRFRIRSEAIRHPVWGVCKYGIFPLYSKRSFWPLWLSLLA